MDHYLPIIKNEVDIYVLKRKDLHAYMVNWEETLSCRIFSKIISLCYGEVERNNEKKERQRERDGGEGWVERTCCKDNLEL